MTQIIPTAEPFFFPGSANDKNARIGCLVTHGFTGAPKEMRWLGEYLNRQGYTVCGIRLTGHATRPEDMIRSRYQDWLLSIEDGYNLLRSCTDQIFLLGLSMGAVLSLTSAASLPVKGVVAMSPPFEMPVKAAQMMPAWGFRLASKVFPYQEKGKHPGDGWFDKDALNQHVSYPRNPVRCAGELKLLLEQMRAVLPKVTVPVLLIQSRDDHYILPDSIDRVHSCLGSTDKQVLWVQGGGHVITEEPTRDEVFKAADGFINRVSGLP